MEVAAVIIPPRVPWYTRRKRDVENTPAKFPDWKISNNQLYFYRPHPVIGTMLRDLDAWKLVLPDDLREQAIHEAHDEPQAGHLGIDKTYRRVATTYYWPSMFRDIAKYVSRCDTCQRSKVEQAAPAGQMGRRVVEEPWTVIAMDIMGPLPRSKSGHEYILVMQDLFTKWVECTALRKATGKLIHEVFDESIANRWGVPKVILSDNGTEFNNKIIEEVAETYNIVHSNTPPYHPQANPVERVNRVLKTMIIAYVEHDHREWNIHLHDFRFAYNTAHHTSLGTSPAFLNFGRCPKAVNTLRQQVEGPPEIERQEPKLWAERMRRIQLLRDWVIENLDNAYSRQAEYYNLRRRPQNFKEGDLVMKRHRILSSAAKHVAAKLAKKFQGPFEIIRLLSPVVYEVCDVESREVMGVVHAKDLKHYRD